MSLLDRQRISRRGVRFVARFEGFRTCPYQDSAGVWTIGYGETQDVGPHTPCISKRKARKLLRERLNRYYAPGVRKAVHRKLRQRDLDALTSFAYNLGLGALQTSTLLQRWNSGQNRCTVAKQELPKWVHGGGVVLPGLVTRRHAEARLICTGHYS